MPEYVTNKVMDSRRQFARSTRVCNYPLYKSLTFFSTKISDFPQQKNSVVFRGVHGQDETYNAYEKDITVVSFYFKEPRVFEYARQL